MRKHLIKVNHSKTLWNLKGGKIFNVAIGEASAVVIVSVHNLNKKYTQFNL